MPELDDSSPTLHVPVTVADGGHLPEHATIGAAGADLRASAAVEIPPGGRAAVPTGLRVQIPRGHVGLVWPRSGRAVRHGIDTLAGVIDSDYRGEVRVVLVNHGPAAFPIAPGDRVASSSSSAWSERTSSPPTSSRTPTAAEAASAPPVGSLPPRRSPPGVLSSGT